MWDPAKNVPVAPLRTQQGWLVFADKTLGGWPAEEADMGTREDGSPLGPSG